MKFIEKGGAYNIIEVGDIVEYGDNIGILAHMHRTVYIDDLDEDQVLEFPYVIVSLNTGLEMNAYKDLELLNKDRYDVRLISKNKDVTLTY